MRYLSRYGSGEDGGGHAAQRMAWPEASMTWSDRMRFHQGDLSHRDASFPIAPAAGATLWRSPDRPFAGRQDVPNGKGSLLFHTPKALETFRASRMAGGFPNPDEPGLPAAPATPRGWEPMRSRAMGSSRDVSPAMASPRLPVEDWQHKLHAAFPRVSGQVKPKAELYAMRSAARWQERLKERAETPRY